LDEFERIGAIATGGNERSIVNFVEGSWAIAVNRLRLAVWSSSYRVIKPTYCTIHQLHTIIYNKVVIQEV